MDSELKSPVNYKILSTLIIGIILGATAGWTSAVSVYKKKIISNESDVRLEIRTTLEEKGLILSEEIDEVLLVDLATNQVENHLLGEIIDIRDSVIVIESLSLSNDVFSSDALQSINIKVSENTSLFSRSEKDFEIYSQEQAVWDDLVSGIDPEEADTLPPPPNQFTETEISLEDLQLGDVVIIESDEIYSGEESVMAVVITVEHKKSVDLDIEPELLPAPEESEL